MDIQIRRIKDLVELLEKHHSNGGDVELTRVTEELEKARDNAARKLLLNGETVGTVVMTLAMSPARVRELANDM